MGRRNNSGLDRLKYEVSQELGYINTGAGSFSAQDANYEISSELGIGFSGNKTAENEYSQFLENSKFEIANELGIQLNHGYNGDITSRDAGRIGGKIGGKIGGNMVKKMVEYAEKNMLQ